jgi:hypothetical protein
MIMQKEQVKQEKAEQLSEIIKSYIDEMDNLSDSADFNIDSIEEKWTELVESTKLIYKEVNAQIIERISEKQIIKEKKGIRRERGDTEKRQEE